MAKRVATITFNPAYDLVGSCQQITLGEVNLVNTGALHAAGKGINVAKVLHDLGNDVTVSGFLGQENLDGFIQLFKQLTLDNQFHLVAGRTRINVKITEQNSNVTDFNFSGFALTAEDWQHFAQQSLQWLRDYEIVVVSGSLPAGLDLTAFSQWMQQLAAICPKLVFDSSRQAFNTGLAAKPWLVKPNESELAMWAGKPLSSQADIIHVAQQICDLGVQHVVVSLGSEGAIWVNAQQCWLAKPPPCQVVSTVGAGDSMVAGLVHGQLHGQSIADTFRLATAVAALSVSQTNVGIADQAVLADMMQRIELIPLA